MSWDYRPDQTRLVVRSVCCNISEASKNIVYYVFCLQILGVLSQSTACICKDTWHSGVLGQWRHGQQGRLNEMSFGCMWNRHESAGYNTNKHQ